MKKVLMIAFHYPPCYGSSGLQRTLSFSRHLSKFGWQPIVLSASRYAYPSTSDGQLGDIPEEVIVERAPALDVVRHLSLKGRYFSWQAIPDRWKSWSMAAVPYGMRLIKKHNPDLIWSTYPIATAHHIGGVLQKLSGLPWVADFRDPMLEIDEKTQQPFPSDKRLWNARERIERRIYEHADKVVFTTRGAKKIFKDRYNIDDDSRLAIVSNGFEEEKFAEIVLDAPARNGKMTLLHSGTLYPSDDRHPKYFFDALASLKKEGTVSFSNLSVILRATGYDDIYSKLIAEKELGDIVSLQPAIPYDAALREMTTVDGLLVFQGYTSNPAIPAKIYEYFRAKRPIFAMLDSNGDTAHLLDVLNTGIRVSLTSTREIREGLQNFIAANRRNTESILDNEKIALFSRERLTKDLSLLFDSIVSTKRNLTGLH